MPRMLAKLIKKSRRQQYDVSSKDVFVITVELLDNALLECTLSAESTGRDCLDNVSQRLGLQQPDLFGLKYVSRRSYPKIRWVDLDRPLKKQLDKYSTEPYLFLGVIFYVTDVSLLEDEVTRYHYFLQLKMDVVEGRLRCNHEQAIVLASYSLQAEFGDHDQEKHTAEYLKEFPLLPKPMMAQFEDRIGALTDAVVMQHASLAGIAQQLAEIYYIVGAQQLEGYGQECFLAKDDAGNEVLLAPSLIGICVRKGNGQQPQFFKWNEITNLVNHKKYFGIECQQFEFSVQFVFDEPDAAKYVWKMCVLQHTFYKMHQTATENSEINITLTHPIMSTHDNNFYTSRSTPGIKQSDIASFQRQSQNIPAKVELKAGAGSSSSKLMMSNNNLFGGPKSDLSLTYSNRKAASRAKLGSRDLGLGGRMMKLTPSSSVTSPYFQSNTSLTNLSEAVSGSSHVWPHDTTRLSGARSTNDLDQLGLHNSVIMSPSGSNTIVPPYRPAPDYETAVMSKYVGGNMTAMSQLYSSQPSLHPLQMTSQPGGPLDLTSHNQTGGPLDLTQPCSGPMYLSTMTPMPENHLSVGYPLTTSHTYSTPELNTTGNPPRDSHNRSAAPLTVFTQQRVYSPAPPAYLPPPTTTFSSSTPDLASQASLLQGPGGVAGGVVGVGGSSPDLVSRRTLGAAAVRSGKGKPNNSELHRTYDNLTVAYSTEELNQVYNISLDQEHVKAQQAHLLHNLQNSVENTFEAGPGDPGLHQTYFEGYGGHLYKDQLDTHQLAAQNLKETEGEPIYQNQGQLLSASHLQPKLGEETQEPIYQNLLNLNLTNTSNNTEDQSDRGSVHIDDTVDGLTLGQGGINISQRSGDNEEIVAEHISKSQQIQENNKNNFMVRKGVTTSRENISFASEHEKSRSTVSLEKQQFVYKEGQEGRKKLEMRQYLEPAVQPNVRSVDESLINTVNSSLSLSRASSQSFDKLSNSHFLVNNSQSGETMRKQSNCSVSSLVSDHENSVNNNTTRSKGRKRWGLNMAVKSGSVKSNKSEKSDKSGDESRHSSGRGKGVGAMLANLHGLTRSRPDILSDSNISSDAFTVPTKIPRESLGNYLEAKLTEGEVVKEFERIPKKKAECNVTIANLSENITRNRFKDVVPYDENRVKITNEKDNKFGYVNASHISATVGNSQRFYIAAQGPLPNTVHNFWAMVLECDVHLIVMLTEVSGANKTSACIPYWPQNDGSSLEIGDFTITKMFSSESSSYKTTTLQLSHTPSRRSRRVWHLQYSGWQDHGCPEDVSQYLAFCEEMGALRRHTVSEVTAGVNSNTPVLVHCSAGVGRTGVTILADILLYCIDHNIHIDIPKVLTHLRQQRMMMVQTVSQYKFVHTVLIKYLSQSRLI